MSNVLLCVRPGGMGDGLLLAPTLETLRQHYDEIHFLGESKAGVILQGARLIDKHYKQSREAGVYSGFIEVLGKLGHKNDETWKTQARGMLGDPDQVLMFSQSPLDAAGGLESLGINNSVIEPWSATDFTHVADHHIASIRNMGYKSEWRFGKPYTLPKTNMELSPRISRLINNDTIILHPDAARKHKRWPIDNWLNLANAIKKKGLNPIVIEAPGMKGLKAKFPGIHVLSDLSIEDMVALCEKELYYIGNDTGTTHLASMTNCPTIALFGPTMVSMWHPIGGYVQIIKKCELEDNYRYCYSEHDCMEMITVKMVMREVQDFFHL